MNRQAAHQILTYPPSSQNLALNLQSVLGYDKIPNSHAHHIIPRKEAQAAGLRDLLDRYGIHLDDAANGTFMITKGIRNQFPDNADWLDGLGPNHRNHPANCPYITQLQQDLARFDYLDVTPASIDALKNELQKIAMKLVNNEYPWPL